MPPFRRTPYVREPRERLVYRTRPQYEIVPRERLPGPARERLASASDMAELYGVLRPREDAVSLPVKAVDRDTALLLLTLREPGPLSGWAREEAGDERIRELVLEGVLEVKTPDGFVGGPEALSLLAGETGQPDGGPLPRLSREALEHGAALPADSVEALARRLYGYNRLPLTPDREGRLRGPAGVRSFLGLGSSPSGGWRPLGGTEDSAWLSWRRTGVERGVDTEVKLYVSPVHEALPDLFPAVAAGLREGAAAAFKVGATAADLLRPDKLVAYLPDREALRRCAGILEEALAGAAAQEVPFTAPAGAGALLSWGADPPAPGGRSVRRSWRSWICRRLAVYLLEAREEPPARRVDYARERIRAEGVDPDAWRPSEAIWGAP